MNHGRCPKLMFNDELRANLKEMMKSKGTLSPTHRLLLILRYIYVIYPCNTDGVKTYEAFKSKKALSSSRYAFKLFFELFVYCYF